MRKEEEAEEEAEEEEKELAVRKKNKNPTQRMWENRIHSVRACLPGEPWTGLDTANLITF